MNILLKSSILAFLTASSVVSADSLCTRVGNNAADLIIIQNWCTPEGFAPKGSLDPEERCRELAIRQCRSTGTLQNAINQICPNNPETPSQSDLFNLGNKCVRTVDGLIGRTQDEYAQANGVFLAEQGSVLDGFKAGQQAVERLLKGRNRSDCRNLKKFKSQARSLKDRQFPNKGNPTTRAHNQSARLAVYNEVKNIENACARPTPPPTPDNSVAGGFRAGQMAMQKWWSDKGSDCYNAWGLRNRAETFKDDMFPDRGNPTVRARNQGARLGVDAEVKSIQDKCFSYAM